MTDADHHNAAEALGGEINFDAELTARYRRLSLLTLDLAEEAGEAAVNFSLVDQGDKKSRFERRIAAMTRAIWAHRVIEQLRGAGHTRKQSQTEATSCTQSDPETGEHSHALLDRPSTQDPFAATLSALGGISPIYSDMNDDYAVFASGADPEDEARNKAVSGCASVIEREEEGGDVVLKARPVETAIVENKATAHAEKSGDQGARRNPCRQWKTAGLSAAPAKQGDQDYTEAVSLEFADPSPPP